MTGTYQPMSQPPKPLNRGVVAGGLIVAPMLLCGALGLAAGSLFGAAVLLGLAGLFTGVVVGFVLVHARFRDL